MAENFLTNFINQLQEAAGIKDWSREAAATANLAGQPGGSIMARPQRSQAEIESPLLGMVMDLARGALNPTNLLENIGGPSQAILGPIRTQAQKKVAKALFRADPELIQAAQSDPRLLNFFTPGAGVKGGVAKAEMANPAMRDAYATFRETMGGKAGEIMVNPRTMLGDKGAIYANLPQVTRHEATHFLRRPSLEPAYSGKQDEAAVMDMIDALRPYLAPVAVKGINQGVARTGMPAVGLDEALAYLSSPMTRSIERPEVGTKLADLLKVRAGQPGTTRGLSLTPETINAATTQAKEAAAPLEQSMLDYISQAFKGWTGL